MCSLSSLTSAQIQAIANVLPAAPAPTPTPTGTPDGVTLYGSYCAGCHNPLATTTKPGRNATQITNAIATVSAMSSLSSLSSAQIQAIANVLPPAPTDGASLYASYCSSCHGPLASSEVRGSSATDIQNAINSVSKMNSIVLTLAQRQAIATALGG
ncbi:Cytochrome C oxidase, cbb3-type, subunit III [uncultured archaeon]|nr:Cytochrome C oxidase, cbb3-type, subunit III [uncultured archaeon]